MSLSYFPMYADDFEADTAHLTLAEDGAYNRLLRLCWRTPGCSIPADRAWIYRRMRALTDEDKAVIDTVLDEFFTLSDGRVSNARLKKEWVAANEAHERRKKAGAKGGASKGSAKSLKSRQTDAGNAKAKPKQPEPEPEPEPQREGVTHHQRKDLASPQAHQSDDAGDDDEHPPPEIVTDPKNAPPARHDKRLTALFDRVLEAAGADVSKDVSGKWVSSAQRGVVEMWMRETDLTDDQIVETVKEVRNAAGKKPSSLRYFSPAIAQRQHDEQRNIAGLPVEGAGRVTTGETAAQRRARERLERDARIAADLDRRFGYADG